jgi:zinc/manganese transport system substrate-binding protein
VNRLIAVILLLAAGSAAAAPLRVVTLSPILTEIAEEVGGPDVAVTGILAPGVDPHTFEPSPSDLRSITRAELVLASGLGLEGYLDRIAANSGTTARIAVAGTGLGILAVPGGRRHEPDPHWWQIVTAMIAATRWVAGEITALRPDSASPIQGRAEAYIGQLRQLDAWVRAEVAQIPADRRVLVTTHDAFGWFARDYGFEVRAIDALSADAEPNARDFATLVEFVRHRRVPAIFPESDENSRLAAALAAESGSRVGPPLYADGLVPSEDGSTYDAMFRHNVRVIVDSLR